MLLQCFSSKVSCQRLSHVISWARDWQNLQWHPAPHLLHPESPSAFPNTSSSISSPVPYRSLGSRWCSILIFFFFFEDKKLRNSPISTLVVNDHQDLGIKWILNQEPVSFFMLSSVFMPYKALWGLMVVQPSLLGGIQSSKEKKTKTVFLYYVSIKTYLLCVPFS